MVSPCDEGGRQADARGESPQVSKQPATSRERLASLDTFRGFIMFWIVGGEAWLISFHSLAKNPITDFLVYELNHTPWEGLRFYDCIWPSFMLMVGVSIPFSQASRSLGAADRVFVLHALKRAIVLFLLGSVRQSVFLGSPYWIELSSALQPIAIAYFAAVLLSRKSVRVQAALVILIWVGYGLLLALVPAHGIPAGSYELNHNLVNAVDLYFLRPHWERWPYAAEGWGTILSTIPTISTTLLGLLMGRLLMAPRSKQTKTLAITGTGVACLALGYALNPWVPVVMKMWTTSYGLASAGYACLVFAFFYWVVDVRGYQKWTLVFRVIGTNAIFIYMATSILPIGEIVGVFTKGIAGRMGSAGPCFTTFSILAFNWIILFWMYKRRIFIKA